MRKGPLKGGSRAGSLPRTDPADRAGGAASDPGDGWARRGAGVPVGMVAVAPGPPGGGQALPCGEPRRAEDPRQGRTAIPLREHHHDHPRSEEREAHRRAMSAPAAALTQERTPRSAMERASRATGGDPVGADGRRLLARSAGGGVWRLADGLLPLHQMAARRPLAAHSGDAPVLANDVTASMPGAEMAL